METQMRQEPRLHELYLYPTFRCNLKCRHCYFAPTYDDTPGRKADEISYEQICQAMDDLLPFGLCACKLSGGEPFLRDDIIGLCHAIDARDLHLVIETNGTLVKRHQADTLGGLRRKPFLALSLDGTKAEVHEALRGVPGCLGKALEGFEHLVRAGLSVQVIAAAYEANKHEIPAIMDMCATRGASSFKVCFIVPVGRAQQLPLITYEECLDLDERFKEHAHALGLTYRSSIPVGLKRVTHIMDTCAFNGRCNITSTLALLADGTITICGMGRYTADFRFGNIGQDDLTEVWKTHPALTRIRATVPEQLRGICGRCVARSACLGHCRLGNENVTLDNLLDPYLFCHELEKRGLFPKSRIIDDRPASAVCS